MTNPTHFELVGEFHDTFGHPQRTEPFTDCFADQKLLGFRMSLMEEELKEFEEAYAKNDLIEMADALCDLSYVTNGCGQCLGINLDKLANDNGVVLCEKNKSIDFSKKRSKEITPYECDLIDHACVEMKHQLDTYNDSVKKSDFNQLGNSLVYLLEVVYDLGRELRFDMDKMFREVHRSNMTKVCSNQKDAEESVEQYVKEGRYEQPTIRTKNKYFVVYDNKTSKILKNHRWENPNLTQFLNF
jgi:predicted HAD superfamily Cof-like phosphohydrolase